MNRKADPAFDGRAARVKALVTAAVAADHDRRHVVLSFDEKTGMQARERIAPTKPMTVGYVERPEFEYVRHGTRVLFGLMNVTTGTITAVLSPRRTNEDTARVLKELLAAQLAAGATRVTLLLDQLNTHMSRELVAVIADLCGRPRPDLGDLDTMAKRRAWLEQEDKAIVFCFTPKHASWLNMVEIEIGVLKAQCLDRRLAEREALVREIAAWEAERNAAGARIRWMFTTEQARVKLGRVYRPLAKAREEAAPKDVQKEAA